jgi:hypothetical protein
MSTRELSTVQFADSTVIDSDKIAQFTNDLTNRFNNLNAQDDVSSWVQQSMVWGLTPRSYKTLIGSSTLPPIDGYPVVEAPFLPAIQSGTLIPTNAVRLKGTDIPGMALQLEMPGKYANNGWIWQTSFYTEEPIVITDTHMWLYVDENSYAYPDGWEWGTNRILPEFSDTWVEDVIWQLEVDSPFLIGDARGSSIEHTKKFFSLDAQASMVSAEWTSGAEDMFPQLIIEDQEMRAYGICISGVEMNIPIPARSRIRFNLFIPDWATSFTVQTGDNRWMTSPYNPVNLQCYNATCHYLKRKN